MNNGLTLVRGSLIRSRGGGMSTEDSLAGASWIRPQESRIADAGHRPAHELGTDFVLPAVPEVATLAVTAHGLVEVFVNRVKVGDDELLPGFTSYRKRLQVFSYE